MARKYELAVDRGIKEALEANHTDDELGPAVIQQTIVDQWVGTFMHQFIVKDAELRQNAIDFVCQHRPGRNTRLGDIWKFGSYNYNIEIIFDDGITFFRFQVPGVVVYPDDKVKAEVATIRYVADHTTIPVPHIYHWGIATENPTGLRVPFMIMEHIPHATTLDQALEDSEFNIPFVPDTEKREYLYQKMAEISLQLYGLTSDRIGSLGILDNGGYAVTSAPLPHNTAYQVVNCRVPVAVLPPRDKTYSSSAGYFKDVVDMGIAGLLFIDENFIKSAKDCRDEFVARCLVRDIVRRRQNSTGESAQTERSVETQDDPGRETFRLWWDDFRSDNVLLDDNGVVVGVVDWEYTYFAPETYWTKSPWWLPHEIMYDYIDKDAASDTSDRRELPHEAEQKEEQEGKRNFQEHWDELVRTYLCALEKAEENFHRDEHQPRRHHLCSGFSRGQAVDSPAEPQASLSQRMRRRWDEEKPDFALTSVFFQGYMLENLFWDYVDEEFWGENAVGGHEGRLGVLAAPCRMLMDWFVDRKGEEKKKWDPRALLDKVLEQMDGKSSSLTV